MQYSIENDILRLTVDSHGASRSVVIHKPPGPSCSGRPTLRSGNVMRRFFFRTQAS